MDKKPEIYEEVSVPKAPYELIGSIGTTRVICGCCEPKPNKTPETGSTPVTIKVQLKRDQNGYVNFSMKNFTRHLSSEHNQDKQHKKVC